MDDLKKYLWIAAIVICIAALVYAFVLNPSPAGGEDDDRKVSANICNALGGTITKPGECPVDNRLGKVTGTDNVCCKK